MIAVIIELKERNKIRRQYLFFSKRIENYSSFVFDNSGGNSLDILEFWL